MAVSLVGTGTFIKSTGNGNATTLTFSTGAAASGDLVIAWWVQSRGALVANLKSSAGTAYTFIGSSTGVTGPIGQRNGRAAYRILTSSETTVTSCATGSGQDSVILAAIVLRGIDPTPTISVNSTTGNSSLPDSPSVTVGSPNSAVITAIGLGQNTTVTAPSGYLNEVSTGVAETRPGTGGLAWKSTNAGAQDPDPWAAALAGEWVGYTITVGSTEVTVFSWYPISSYPDMINEQMPMIGY